MNPNPAGLESRDVEPPSPGPSTPASPGLRWDRAVVGIALAHALVHLLPPLAAAISGTDSGAGFGIFRDEYYYLACARRLAFGYVDHPPLSILVLRGWTALFGDSMLALRVPPALAGVVLILMTARLARRMGGGPFASGLAALAAAIAPSWLAITGFYSMNAFDLLLWTCAFDVLLGILLGGDPRAWLLFGGLAGIALQNKIGGLVFGFGVGVGLLATPEQRHLRAPWIWLGAALAGLIFLPHVLWQMQNGWPTREFVANAKAGKITPLGPLGFLLGQALELHPLNVAVWGAGLWGLLRGRHDPRLRAIGVAWVVACAVFALQRAKAYYLAAAYAPLLAMGGVVWERVAAETRGRWTRPGAPLSPRVALPCALLLGGALTAPLVTPILPPMELARAMSRFGVEIPSGENHAPSPIPQPLADRIGWRELAWSVGEVARSLPESDHARAVVFARNYGEAGALEYHAREFGLPPVACGHNAYHAWSMADLAGAAPPDAPARGEVVLAVGLSVEKAREFYDDARVAAVHVAPLAMPYEARLEILVCRGPKKPLREILLAARFYV